MVNELDQFKLDSTGLDQFKLPTSEVDQFKLEPSSPTPLLQSKPKSIFERVAGFSKTVLPGLSAAAGRVGELGALAIDKNTREQFLSASPEQLAESFPFLYQVVEPPSGEVAKKLGGEAIQQFAEGSGITKLPGASTVLGRIAQTTAVGAASGLGKGVAEDLGAEETKRLTKQGAVIGLVVSGALESVRGLAGLLRSPKVASVLTNVPKKNYDIAAKSTSAEMKAAKSLVSDPDSVTGVAQSFFDDAKELHKAAQEAWKTQEASALAQITDPSKASQTVFDSVDEALKAEKIDLGSGKYGKYVLNDEAKKILTDVRKILTEPVDDASELLVRREALGNIDLSKDARSAGRLLTIIKKAYDTALDAVTGGQASTLRANYAKTAGPALDLINATSDNFGNFDPDKGTRFLKQAMSTVKINNAEIISELSDAAGKDFIKQVQTMGAASALSSLKPPTGSRVFDILAAWGVTKIPLVSGIFSPLFWGNVITGSQLGQKAASNLMAKWGTILLDKVVNQ